MSRGAHRAVAEPAAEVLERLVRILEDGDAGDRVEGGATTARCAYRLVFERGEVNVSFDVEGEGEAARIIDAFDRKTGRDMRVRAAR